jgi:hypothetical protein
MKRTLAFVMAIAAAGLVASASSGGHTTKRSGALHVTKECSEYDFQAGDFCTILSSNVPQIKRGMRVVYLQAPGPSGLDSDIVLSRNNGSAAFGHVVLNATTSRVTFSGGTGALAGFRAAVDVSVDEFDVWHWEGTYSFTRPAEDD